MYIVIVGNVFPKDDVMHKYNLSTFRLITAMYVILIPRV